MLTSNSAEEAATPIIFFSRIIGCAPLKKNFIRSYVLILYSIILNCFFSVLNVIYTLKYSPIINDPELDNSTETKLSFFLDSIKMNLFCFIYVFTSFRVDRVKNIFQTCKEVDDILKKFDGFVQYDNKKFWFIVSVKLILVMLSSLGRVVLRKNIIGRLHVITGLPVILTPHASIMQFEMLSRLMRSRLEAVNRCLSSHSSKEKCLSMPERVENIALNLVKAHYSLILIGETLNEIYSFQLLTYCFNVFIMINLSSFEVIQSLTDALDSEKVSTEQWLASLPMLLLFLTMLWTLIICCEDMKNEVR